MKIHRLKITTAALSAALYLAPLAEIRADADSTRTRDTRTTTTRTDLNATATIGHGKLRLAPEDIGDRTVRKIEGQKVRGANREDLGTVKDLLIEPHSGKVAFAVVASGGLLGLGETLRLVPYASLQRNADDDGFVMQLTQDQWKEMPVIDRKAYSDGNFSVSAADQRRARQQPTGAVVSTRNEVNEVRTPASVERTVEPQNRVTERTVDVQPATRTARTTAATAATRDAATSTYARTETGVQTGSLDNVIRASTLRGKAIHAGDRKVGKIDEVVLDWHTGEATAVLDLDRDFTGTNRKFMVPVSELAIRGEDQDVVVANFTRADFAQFAQDTTADTRLTPTGRNDVVERRTTTERRDVDPRSVAVPDRNVSPMLQSAVRSVKQNIDNHPSLKGADVEVLAYNGKILLRGFVESEEMKERLEDAAEQAAAGVSMDSHILIRNR